MSFTRTVPKNSRELFDYLKLIHENRGHVKKVEVNLTTCHLEVSLDWGAHVAGKPDVYLPLKRGKLNDAKMLIEKVLKESEQGFAPSESEAGQIFDMIDPSQN